MVNTDFASAPKISWSASARMNWNLGGHLLAPAAQARLDDLLARKSAQPLPTKDQAELDGLLHKTDQLTILKTRARFTLNRAKAETAGT
jgi:hypothetical protein